MCIICVARLRAAGKHPLVRKVGNSAIKVLVNLIIFCGVGALKNLLCTTSKTGFKISQELDYELSSSPANSRNNENFAIICTIMMCID